MDLAQYSKEDLLCAAMKSEEDSYQLYTKLASDVENGLMKDKFMFLANEEQKHKQFLEDVFHNEFPGKSLVLPETSLVPLPEVVIPEDEDISISAILKKAMMAEKAAADFYLLLSKRFETIEVQHMLRYFSDMELGHMKLLEQERMSVEWFEQADVYWPMVHAGP